MELCQRCDIVLSKNHASMQMPQHCMWNLKISANHSLDTELTLRILVASAQRLGKLSNIEFVWSKNCGTPTSLRIGHYKTWHWSRCIFPTCLTANTEWSSCLGNIMAIKRFEYSWKGDRGLWTETSFASQQHSLRDVVQWIRDFNVHLCHREKSCMARVQGNHQVCTVSGQMYSLHSVDDLWVLITDECGTQLSSSWK